MSAQPLRCGRCGSTDFLVISSGVSYQGGTIVEMYRWPEQGDELEGENEHPHVHAHGYLVEQDVLEEPELSSIRGPVRALCASCLSDMTDQYVQIGRTESLPV